MRSFKAFIVSFVVALVLLGVFVYSIAGSVFDFSFKDLFSGSSNNDVDNTDDSGWNSGKTRNLPIAQVMKMIRAM